MRRASRYALGGLLAAAFTALAPLALATTPEALAERLQVRGEPMPVESVTATPLVGFFEVRLDNGETFYSDSSGRFFLVGDIYENGEAGLVNLTEQARNGERAERLAGLPEGERVIFRGTESRAVVTVFTDPTCPFCVRLHEEVPALNEQGIEVHYLAFPRSGMSSPGGRELQQIWCDANPSEAMNLAKSGGTLEGRADCDNPVEAQYHLGMEIGVQGTPAIVLPDGQLVPGYVPAERLAAMLGLDD